MYLPHPPYAKHKTPNTKDITRSMNTKCVQHTHTRQKESRIRPRRLVYDMKSLTKKTHATTTTTKSKVLQSKRAYAARNVQVQRVTWGNDWTKWVARQPRSGAPHHRCWRSQRRCLTLLLKLPKTPSASRWGSHWSELVVYSIKKGPIRSCFCYISATRTSSWMIFWL